MTFDEICSKPDIAEILLLKLALSTN